jgi:hypothetical protein
MSLDGGAPPGTDLCTGCSPMHTRCRHLADLTQEPVAYPCTVEGCHCPGGQEYITATMLPIKDTINGRFTGPMGPCRQPAKPPEWWSNT